ncbi:MAG: transcriptional regulator GcvA [Rhodospirillales bacterium]|nr:transcriptional regulator GcvA [Rhodospirillales bacterium]MDH3791907.1 transcriptional regulator GcvA [Rhodospirillales bacterium]MDH3912088.1 transcriptional regulator GcvA [Rhodospirillales bacterium]MDH3970293.1 transcriptional regulator GcvA [Rhodospirillales bacterium]
MVTSRAADELHVTQSAVSHQIRSLEQHWGLRLFRRDRRQVKLTDNGRALLPVVRTCFENVAGTVRRLRDETLNGPLRVSLLQSFAVKWLLPRLAAFRDSHPSIQVWLSTTSVPVDLEREEVDVAIRLGRDRARGLHRTPLMEEQAFAVCSPAYLQRHPDLKSARDLPRHPLIRVISPLPEASWQEWFRDAGLPDAEPSEGVWVSDSGMAMQAAIDGQGLALGRTALALDDLAAGRLVRLFDVVIPCEAGYDLVCPKGTEDKPKVAVFREWLLAMSAESAATYRALAERAWPGREA